MMDKFLKMVRGFVAVLVIIFFVAWATVFPTKWLWNWIIVDLFALKPITAWQAWGLNLICGILFRGSSSSSES